MDRPWQVDPWDHSGGRRGEAKKEKEEEEEEEAEKEEEDNSRKSVRWSAVPVPCWSSL